MDTKQQTSEKNIEMEEHVTETSKKVNYADFCFDDLPRKKKLFNPKSGQATAFALLGSSAVFILLVLVLFLGFIIFNGLRYGFQDFNFKLIFSGYFPAESTQIFGFLGSILGTVLLLIGSLIIALPLGLLAAIYLNEYATENKLTIIIDQAVNNLAGVPSIVIGAFGLAFFSIFLKMGKSMIAGWLTLACMILPTIIRTSQEALKSVPNGYREGSLALGVTKWQTIRHVVLPTATPGIATGVILSLGRAAGETAAILFVGSTLVPREIFLGFNQPFQALPTTLLWMYRSRPTDSIHAQWLVAFVLVIVVFSFNGLAIFLRNRAEKKREGT
jgi:phosphate transport system permease protein